MVTGPQALLVSNKPDEMTDVLSSASASLALWR